MCGIFGLAGDLWYKEEATMKSLFLLNYFRGPDSSGLASVSNNGDVKIAKLASDPITLFQMGSFRTALNGNTSKLFLGHNRATTSGLTSNYNAHPYQFGHIVGCMNGTLETKDKAVLEEILGERFEVDSMAVFACIAKIGIKDTIELLHEGKTYEKGAWALVWYDLKEDTLNFLRNKHRPLWFAWDKGFKRMIFSSQWQMINHAAEMASPAYELERVESKKKSGNFFRFFSVPEDTHLKYDLDVIKKGSTEKPKPVAKLIKGKEPEKVGFVQSLFDPFGRDDPPVPHMYQAPRTTPSTTNRSLSSLKDRVVHLFGTPEEPYSSVLSYWRFSELASITLQQTTGMCSYCHKDIVYGEAGITVYDNQDCILCPECSGHVPTGTEAMPQAKLYVSKAAFQDAVEILKLKAA